MKSTIIILLSTSIFLCGCGGEKSPEKLMALAQKSYDQGDYLQARKYLAEAIKLKPTDKEIGIQISQTYMAENMFDSAYSHLSRTDKLYPFDRKVNQLLHEVSVKTNHWGAAINALLILAQTGDSIEQYYHQIGEYALNDSAGHVAYYYFGKLIELEPDSLSHYLNQADGGVLAEEPQESIDVLNTALKRFGDVPLLLSRLGELYGIMGNFTESEKVYRLLVSKDSSAVNQLELATCLSLQDKRAKKEEAYRIFKKLRLETANFARVDSILKVLEEELTQR